MSLRVNTYVLTNILFIWLTGGWLNAQSGEYTMLSSHDDISEQIQKFSNQLTTIQSEFTQVKRLHFLEADLESSGKFWFQAPDKVRWEYLEPYNYIVILNEGKLNLISESSENQIDMRSNDIFEQINALIITAVSGNIFNNSNYTVNVFENDSFFKIELKPQSSSISMMIEMMELYFNKKDYSMSKIKMIEPTSDYSMISFINSKYNGSLPDNIFTH